MINKRKPKKHTQSSHKRFLTKTINFGEKGNRARAIIEHLIEKNNQFNLSAYVQKLIIASYIDDPNFSGVQEQLRKRMLLDEHTKLLEETQAIVSRRRKLEERMIKAGIDPEGLI